jgi:hypothetical protein
MAASGACTTTEEDELASTPMLKALVIYEDLATALRAKHSLGQLCEQLSPEAEVHIRLWRLDLLNQPLLAEQAAIEAATSDLIVLSLHRGQELRGEACGWLARWLEHQTNRPCTLAALLDPAPERSGSEDLVLAYLRRIAQTAHAELFWGCCPPAAVALHLARNRAGRRSSPGCGREGPWPTDLTPPKAA